MELIEWLTSILDEDECIAEASHSKPWRWNYQGDLDGDVPPWAKLESGDDTVIACEGELVMFGTADAEHIALHDPVAVLADIAAKRRLLNLCAEWTAMARSTPGSAWYLLGNADKVCRLLASGYAHRDGFDQSWA